MTKQLFDSIIKDFKAGNCSGLIFYKQGKRCRYFFSVKFDSYELEEVIDEPVWWQFVHSWKFSTTLECGKKIVICFDHVAKLYE